MLKRTNKPKEEIVRDDNKPAIGEGWVSLGYWGEETGVYYEHVTTDAGKEVWYRLVNED